MGEADLDELRASVRRSLPELEEIADPELRAQVVEAHALALSETTFSSLEEIPPSGVPESPRMKRGTQTDHYRAVARMSLAIVEQVEDQLGSLDLDRDQLLAGALVHDVGKAYEFCPRNRNRWQQNRSRTGLPAVRHPAYGVHLALSVGLPEPVVHCVAAHAMRAEGSFVAPSAETRIVQFADLLFWELLEGAGMLEEP